MRESDEEAPLLTRGRTSRETAESFITKLQDDDAQRRWEAAEALGQFAAPRVVEALVSALSDSHPFVRRHAGQALGRISSRIRKRTNGASLLQSFRPEIEISSLVESLVPRAEDPVGHVRAATADALGELRLVSGLPMLLQLLRDADDSVCASAAAALGKLRSERVTGDLIALLNDRSVGVRRSVIEALGAIGGVDAARVLMRELADSDPAMRASAAAALGHCEVPGVTKALIGALGDEHPQVRWQAACALGCVGNITAVPYLGQMKDDDALVFSAAVKDVAQEAARLIKKRQGGLWNAMRRLVHSVKVAAR